MKLGILRTAGLAASLAAVGLLAAPTADAQEKVRWRMHSAFGTNLSVLGPVGPRIAEAVREMSNGDFDIRVFEPGALAGGFAYYDAVSQGAIDAAYGTPGANAGKNTAYGMLASWPFGPGALEFNAWMLRGGGKEIAAELYARDGIKHFYCGLIPPESSGWFREPIESLDQLKGLKMRFFAMGALVMQKLGVSTQQLAAGDIYPALELGTLDATEFSMPSMDRGLGFYQIAKYNYFPGWHQQSTTNEILVNQEKWDALPDNYKVMFEQACLANAIVELADGEAEQPEALIANQADGVNIMTWPDEFLDAMRAAWEEVREEEIAKNADLARIWESYSAFHEKYQIWSEVGYLR